MISRADKDTKVVRSIIDVIDKKSTKNETVNKLVDNNGVTINNEDQIGDVFNNYFVSVKILKIVSS